MKVGASWISGKAGILEKAGGGGRGGMTPLTNYGFANLLSVTEINQQA